MQIRLTKPHLEQFIAEQVRAGAFPSADAAVEAAVEQMMHDPQSELDTPTVEAINRAEAQIDRGEGIEFEQFAAAMRRKIASR